MKQIDKIHLELGSKVCRRCINQQYHADLLPRDCLYEAGEYVQPCSSCHGMHHIVSGFRLSGRLKLLFK